MKDIALLSLGAIALGAFFAPLGSAAGLVTNGNFATGDFTGWNATSSGDPYYTSVSSAVPANPPTDSFGAVIGAYYDDGGNPVVGSISQSFNTVIGQQYTVSFVYGEYNTNPSFSDNNPYDPSDPGNPANCSQAGCYLDQGNITGSNDPSSNPWAQNNTLNVLWNGTSVYSDSNFFTSNNTPDAGESIGDFFYAKGTATVTATSTTTTLEFDASDYQQNVILDDIDVELVTPEPGTLGLLGSALLGLSFLARRRSLRRG
jgi:hypothetical protein